MAVGWTAHASGGMRPQLHMGCARTLTPSSFWILAWTRSLSLCVTRWSGPYFGLTKAGQWDTETLKTLITHILLFRDPWGSHDKPLSLWAHRRLQLPPSLSSLSCRTLHTWRPTQNKMYLKGRKLWAPGNKLQGHTKPVYYIQFDFCIENWASVRSIYLRQDIS